MEKTPNSNAPTLKLVNGPAGRDYFYRRPKTKNDPMDFFRGEFVCNLTDEIGATWMEEGAYLSKSPNTLNAQSRGMLSLAVRF
jgi:hypothetical protein